MGKEHDTIVFSLTEKKIIELLGEKLFGNKGSWSQIHEFHKDKLEFIKLSSIKKILTLKEDFTIGEIQEMAKKDNEEISNLSLENSFEIKRIIEFPMIKGEGQYKVTKGFLDIVVDMKPKKRGFFCCYQFEHPLQIIIEVKKEKDFEDIGAIVRQLNEYKEYYFYNPSNSEIFNLDGYTRKERTIWVVYCDKEIPNMARQMLEEAGYIVLTGGLNSSQP